MSSNIYKKILEVKKEIGVVSKDSTNPFFKSRYFDINSLIQNCDPLLTKNGLVLLQPIKEGKVFSIIIDIDTKEEISSELILPNILDPQKLGSAITYFRRYTLQSLLGIQAEDDDANTAVKQIKKQAITWLTEDQLKLALEGSRKGIEATLKVFSTDTKQMKKEYKEQLENKLKTL